MEEKWFNLKLRRDIFSVGVIRTWNSLPPLVVSAGSIYRFKRLVDLHLSEHNLEGYGNDFLNWRTHRLNWNKRH